MRSRSLPLIAAALLCVPALSFAQVTNGGFEPAVPFGAYALLPGGSASVPGWITTDNGAEWFIPSAYGYANSPDGGYIVDVACYTYTAGGIQQTFATIPGQTYVITFHVGTHAVSGRNGSCQVVVDADGTTQTFSHVNLGSNIIWAQKSFTFVADNGSATLRFRCLQNANSVFAYIDGVGASTPVATENATWGGVKALYRR